MDKHLNNTAEYFKKLCEETKQRTKTEILDQKTANEEEPYWKYIQGHYNPYGKELYDYVAAHKNIKLSKSEKSALRDMKELNYKIHACPDELDKPTLLCEKSFLRLLIEFLFDLPDII